ncbi:MAG: ABC transporter substrate-binding protein [Rhodopila sp.]|nr:ABC transporter substrate-binding protein [Rhodopila sp.]
MLLSRRATLQALTAAVLATPVVARSADPFRIGTVLSVTGPAAFLGQDMKDGAQLAVEQINLSGGIDGREVEWIFHDAQSETQRAINDTRKLLTSDRVDIIVGGGSMSGIALAMSAMCEQAKVPFISTEGAAGIVAPVAQHRWSFKSTVDDDLAMQRLADYFDKRGIQRIALLADTSGFGQSATEQLRAVASARGLSLTALSFSPGDTDLVPQLTAAREAKAQAIICWTVTPAGLVFLKQAQQLALHEQATLIHGYGFVANRYMELAGNAADPLLLLSQKFVVGDELPDNDPVRQPILALDKAFRERWNRAPNQFVAQTYDAVQMARTALAQGGKDREKVRQALEAIHGLRLASGVFDFSPDRHAGLSKQNLVLVSWRGGRFHLADYT